jgi:hypothetical protein
MSTMEPSLAAKVLGLDACASSEQVHAAFKALALVHHPDKNGGTDAATEFFQHLLEARDVLLCVRGEGVLAPQRCPKCQQEVQPPSDAACSRFRCPLCHAVLLNPNANQGGTQAAPKFSTHGGETELLRGFECSIDVLTHPHPEQLAAVWRCKDCLHSQSVCCKIRPAKYSCLCGHRYKEHAAARGFACERRCGCTRFRFHVQINDWQARCGCKHKHTDHDPSSAFSCSKKIPGGKPCPCRSFLAKWVCNCGHEWAEHETCWVEKAFSHVERGREWVCGGVRPELTKIAEERRREWVRQGKAPSGASEVAKDRVMRALPRGRHGAPPPDGGAAGCVAREGGGSVLAGSDKMLGKVRSELRASERDRSGEGD